MPTVDLTIHFRARPADPLAHCFVLFDSPVARDGYLVEHGRIWSAGGRSDETVYAGERVKLANGTFALGADTDKDVIDTGDASDSVSTGGGDDVNHDVVTLGPGNDSVSLASLKVVPAASFDGGDGTDRVRLAAGASNRNFPLASARRTSMAPPARSSRPASATGSPASSTTCPANVTDATFAMRRIPSTVFAGPSITIVRGPFTTSRSWWNRSTSSVYSPGASIVTANAPAGSVTAWFGVRLP